MSERKYTRDHEWVLMEDATTAIVGISDYAQSQLGDIVFVEMPEVDSEVEAGDEVVVLESVKAAGDIKSPLTGSITEVNETLIDTPDLINQDAENEGWIYKLNPSEPGEIDALMDEKDYQAYLQELE